MTGTLVLSSAKPAVREQSGQELRQRELQSAVASAEMLLATLSPHDAAEEFDRTRIRAEVAAQESRRVQHSDTERHYGKLRLLAEAALGVLSLDGYEVQGQPSTLLIWRVLACGFERGVLFECCGESVIAKHVANEIRRRGYNLCPGSSLGQDRSASGQKKSFFWSEARLIARERGIALTSLPPDRSRNQATAERRIQYARARAADAERVREHVRKQRIAKIAKCYPDASYAYGFLRKTMDALQRIPKLPVHRQAMLNDAFQHLHAAEDLIAKALKAD